MCVKSAAKPSSKCGQTVLAATQLTPVTGRLFGVGQQIGGGVVLVVLAVDVAGAWVVPVVGDTKTTMPKQACSGGNGGAAHLANGQGHK